MLNTIMYNGQYLQSGSPHTFTVDTPLVFQWLPRKYGYLIPEKYVERLSEWAKRESTRVVKLVINGSGFTPMQRKELENKISSREFNPNKNIELIDFNELDLGEYEFSFHLQKMWQIEKSKCPLYKVSQYFRDLYSIPEDERLSFGVEIDSMRIFMLLALKSPMIYLDFDILPTEDKKICEIHAKQGFLLAENEGTGHSYSGMINIENAIIAVSDAGRIKITEIYNEVKRRFKTCYPTLRSAPSYVYTITDGIILNSLSHEYLFDKKSVIEEIFGFKTNGGEVDIQYDNSWTKNKDELYTKEEIAKIDSDTRVATDMKGLITEPIYNGEHMYRVSK